MIIAASLARIVKNYLDTLLNFPHNDHMSTSPKFANLKIGSLISYGSSYDDLDTSLSYGIIIKIDINTIWDYTYYHVNWLVNPQRVFDKICLENPHESLCTVLSL